MSDLRMALLIAYMAGSFANGWHYSTSDRTLLAGNILRCAGVYLAMTVAYHGAMWILR